MAGIQKECRTCKVSFITRSSNSARWETQCMDCFSARKKEAQMIRFQERETNVVSNLEDRIIKVEGWMDNIPSIIGAEVNNIMHNITSEEMINSLQKVFNERLEKAIENMNAQQKAFQEKMQRQIVTLNNKIIKLMKEME